MIEMADPSIAGARQRLIEQLISTFPSVPEETIRLITQQHSSDPAKCWDLVRLESSRPTTLDQQPSVSNGQGDLYFQWPSAMMRPSGSYVIRRRPDAPQQTGAPMVRDSRSCTPPRAPQSTQGPGPGPAPTGTQLTRPQTLPVRPVLTHISPSPLGQQRPSMTQDSGIHSYPGTPTGGPLSSAGPKTSVGYVGSMIPALKINCGGSQIMLSSSPTPASPTLVFSSQPTLVNRPVYYLTRTTSQAPGTTTSPVWQYDRRPSFADVELAQRASAQQQPANLSSANRESLRVSVDNLSEAGSMTSSPRATSMTVVSSDRGPAIFRTPTNVITGSNIRIQLDPLTGGAVISDASRPRPRVTFIQQQRYPAPAGLTVSLKQAPPRSPAYDGRALVNSVALTQAQAQECLKSCLMHQHSRLVDMKKGMASAKTRLQELRMDVDQMEQDLMKRRKHSVRSAAISDEAMTSLHKETREFQAAVRTMLHELEKLTTDSQVAKAAATTGTVLDKKALLESEPRVDAEGNQKLEKAECNSDGSCDGEQWSCSYCTFKNHVDLPMCECCEMPRITDVDGWQLVYDISPCAYGDTT